jgi:three-Cys-motif partner protein
MPRVPFALPSDPDPYPALVVEKGRKDIGVGRWVPERKHTLIAKWLVGTQHARAGWKSHVFIDPFCGPGRILVRGEPSTRHGGAVLAWRQSQQTKAPFTQMFIGDIQSDRVNACELRLKHFGANVRPFPGAALDTSKQMVAAIPRGTLALAYLDPYNLKYLSFEIIRSIAALKRVDLAVNFSTMDLDRNVDVEIERGRFDDVAPGWKNVAQGRSRASLHHAFFDYWRGLVSELGFKYSDQMPWVFNEGNRGIYRMVFFSRHPMPIGVWGDIAKGPNLELF